LLAIDIVFLPTVQFHYFQLMRIRLSQCKCTYHAISPYVFTIPNIAYHVIYPQDQ